MEIETQVTISKALGFLSAAQEKELFDRTGELARICNGLINSLPATSYIEKQQGVETEV